VGGMREHRRSFRFESARGVAPHPLFQW
jgi:hypothetical protein